MKISVLGASGATGRLVVAQAIAAGHEVTALVRTPGSLEPVEGSLRVVVGDATVTEDLVTAFAGADAVVSALGVGIARSTDTMARATDTMLRAASETGVRRVVVMSAYGVGDSARDAGMAHRLMIRTVMKGTFADKARADDALRASDLDWTLVYPATLSDGPVTGHVTAGVATKVTLSSKISRADVAAFLLAEATEPTWTRQTVVVSS